MSINELLEEFRLLGGTIDNIEIRKGEYGTGLFPIDNLKPVKLHLPQSLLIPANTLIIKDNNLIINDKSDISPNIKKFFANYQKKLSWGNGVFLNLLKDEINWCNLNDEIKNKITDIFKMHNEKKLFKLLSYEKILEKYILTRSINYKLNDNLSCICIMPIVELINHSKFGTEYKHNNGILVSGHFNEEIFTNYNKIFDPIRFFLQYRFNTNANIAYSLPVRLIYENKYIEVLRNFHEFDSVDDTFYPKKIISDDGVELSYLEIGNTENPQECRRKFNYLIKDLGLNSNTIFDQLQAYNRNCYLELLTLLKKYNSKFNSLFELAVIQQLQAMSYYW